MAAQEMHHKVPGLLVSHPKKQGRILIRRSHSPSYCPLAMISWWRSRTRLSGK
jgi:hypothetical protein